MMLKIIFVNFLDALYDKQELEALNSHDISHSLWLLHNKSWLMLRHLNATKNSVAVP